MDDHQKSWFYGKYVPLAQELETKFSTVVKRIKFSSKIKNPNYYCQERDFHTCTFVIGSSPVSRILLPSRAFYEDDVLSIWAPGTILGDYLSYETTACHLGLLSH